MPQQMEESGAEQGIEQVRDRYRKEAGEPEPLPIISLTYTELN